MNKFKLTDIMVLRAVRQTCSPQSAYIGDELRKMQAAHVSNGGTGHPPTSAQIKRVLDRLHKNDFLRRVSGPDGNYGYRWEIRTRGWIALSREADV